jgi:hypothetical protein
MHEKTLEKANSTGKLSSQSRCYLQNSRRFDSNTRFLDINVRLFARHFVRVFFVFIDIPGSLVSFQHPFSGVPLADLPEGIDGPPQPAQAGVPARKPFSIRKEKPCTPKRTEGHPQAETPVEDHSNVVRDGQRRGAHFGG